VAQVGTKGSLDDDRIQIVDISHVPEMLRVAEEVRDSREARILYSNGEEIALMVPVPQRSKRRGKRRTKTKADYDAFRSAAGSWKDVDTDRLLADIYESRRRSSRPPVEL
jgi:hypothetical protein